ncbi:MAG: site-specific integrase [Ardenticatenaceae bacterium]|nr:site-specific integrase [Ardenticatenaceae bacterium]MCB9445579.1 site-specific integrase [Ardenticatenaceae bacterium]
MTEQSANTSIISQRTSSIIPGDGSSLAQISQMADQAAANYIFADYRQRRSEQTLRTHAAALQLWATYLVAINALETVSNNAVAWLFTNFDEAQLQVFDEYTKNQDVAVEVAAVALFGQNEPSAWQGVSWGLVEGFVRWMLTQGYSISSVNNRLASIRVYARLAAKAGVIPPAEHALIREVRGYGQTEGKRVDEKRPSTRIGYKKEESIVLTIQQARKLKNSHPPTPQGIRDRLLISLLLDLGLRASEAASLKVADFIESGVVTVYRQKTDTTDRMVLTPDIQRALADYEPHMRQGGILLRGSRKGGKLTDDVMSVRAIGSRIKILGRDILGIWELSPHDLRHTWATQAAKHSNPFVLRDAGGWTNMQTPSRYVERAKTVNEGIVLDY